MMCADWEVDDNITSKTADLLVKVAGEALAVVGMICLSDLQVEMAYVTNTLEIVMLMPEFHHKVSQDELVAMVLRRGGSPEQKTVPELRELLKELDPTLCPRPKAEIPGLNRMKKGDLILLAQSRRIDPTGMNADQIRLALTGSKVVMPLPTPTTGTSSKNLHRPLRGYCLSCPECRQPMRLEAVDGKEFWACPSPECDPQKEWAMM